MVADSRKEGEPDRAGQVVGSNDPLCQPRATSPHRPNINRNTTATQPLGFSGGEKVQNCARSCSLIVGWKSSDKVEQGVGEPLLGSKEGEKEKVGEKEGEAAEKSSGEAGTGRGSCKKAGTGWKAAGKSSIDILSALGRRQHGPVSSVVVFVPLCTRDIFDDI